MAVFSRAVCDSRHKFGECGFRDAADARLTAARMPPTEKKPRRATGLKVNHHAWGHKGHSIQAPPLTFAGQHARIGRGTKKLRLDRPLARSPCLAGAQAAVARPYPAVTCHVGVNGGRAPFQLCVTDPP
jgi:hypothetical protein